MSGQCAAFDNQVTLVMLGHGCDQDLNFSIIFHIRISCSSRRIVSFSNKHN